jgi:PPOX class probable F420-dependent enzyme
MSMSDTEIRQLLEQPIVAVLGTADPDGRPALSPVWYLWRGEDAVVCIQRSTRKWRNIQRDPRVSLCVDTKEPPYRAAIVEATAEAVPDADYNAVLREIAIHYYGEERGNAFIDDNPRDPSASVVVRLRPERIVSWAY